MKNFLSECTSVGLSVLKFLAVFAVIFIICHIVLSLFSLITGTVIKKETEKGNEGKRHIVTSMTAVRSIARYVVCISGIFGIVKYFGYETSLENTLVTAGIGGIIISLGAQSFIKDIISGLFILFEHQFEVGDFVEIGDLKGTVTALSVRVTYLDCKGQKVIIPNGQITTVINYSSGYSMFSFTVATAYEQDTRTSIDILNRLLNNYYEKHRDILIEPPAALGVKDLNSSSVDILVKGKCIPLKNYETERELKLLIKEEFEKNHREIPYQKITLK